MLEQKSATIQNKHKLDLRKLPAAERNIRVFQAFESIHPGSVFVLLDNNELKDIHEQFTHDFAGSFRWKQLQKGPYIWTAKIAKLNGIRFEI